MEQNIIPLTTTSEGVQAVMGRDLHAFLEVQSNYTTWVNRLIEKYGFIAGQDFIPKLEKSSGGRPSENHVLTMDMAKEISMVQNNQKGREARQYFIECEKRAKQIASFNPELLPRVELLQLALESERARLELEKKNSEMAPKAEAYDAFLGDGGCYSVSAVAKMLGIGPRRLFRHLRETKILLSDSKNRNLPYAAYSHYFLSRPRVKTINGTQKRMNVILVKPEGVDFIRRHLLAHPML